MYQSLPERNNRLLAHLSVQYLYEKGLMLCSEPLSSIRSPSQFEPRQSRTFLLQHSRDLGTAQAAHLTWTCTRHYHCHSGPALTKLTLLNIEQFIQRQGLLLSFHSFCMNTMVYEKSDLETKGYVAGWKISEQSITLNNYFRETDHQIETITSQMT